MRARRPGVAPRTREAWGTTGRPEKAPEVGGLLERVQTYVFQRRMRVKDNFRDFDPLRCGRCTTEQFARAVNQLVPTLRQSDVDALVDHFTDAGPGVVVPQVVSYQRFARSVDEVFVVPELETRPMLKVPRPGATVLQNSASRPPAPRESEAELRRLLTRLGMLTVTRGIIFKTCFQDCERSDAATVMCPRHGGKVKETQFLQFFPFLEDVTPSELAALMVRYGVENGDVHYLAMHQDMGELVDDSPMFGDCASRTTTCRSPGREDASGSGEAVLAKVKALVAERRLPFHGIFHDYDKLRRGTCRPEQVGAVLAVLNIELTSKELDTLLAVFLDNEGTFNYRDFISSVSEVPLPSPRSPRPPSRAAAPEQPPPPPGSAPALRRRVLPPRSEVQFEEIMTCIATRAFQRRLALLSAFQDFDPIRTGRVTQTQFLRICHTAGLELSEAAAEVLCEVYCDPGWKEFSYVEFVEAVQSRGGAVLLSPGPGQDEYVGRTGGRSKYFNLRGQVMPHLWRTQPPRPCTR